MEQPISTNQNQFGFSQKNEMYIPGLEMLMHLNEVTIKQIWPGCLERKSNLNYLIGQTIDIICYSLQLGVCPQISGIRWPGQSSLLSKRRIHLLYANMLCQFTRVMKKNFRINQFDRKFLNFSHCVFQATSGPRNQWWHWIAKIWSALAMYGMPLWFLLSGHDPGNSELFYWFVNQVYSEELCNFSFLKCFMKTSS